MAELNLIVTPPQRVRVTKSSADANLVQAMVAQIGPDTFVSDGQTYTTYKDASKASGVYRRALAVASGMPAYKFTSTVWGTNGKDDVPLPKDKKGTWRFAFKTAPERQKRERKTKA